MLVPAIRYGDKWAEGLRTSVRTSTAEGWSVREHRGSIRLEMRLKGQPRQSVMLPFDWAKSSVGDALARVRNIYVLASQGHSLKSSAEIAAGKAPNTLIDWAAAVGRFHLQKTKHGATIKQSTWDHSYAPVLADAVGLLTSGKAPKSPEDLIDACIRKLPSGSRARQIRAQSLAQFLRHCVSREGFPAIWSPPTSLREHVGVKPPEATSKAGDAVEDYLLLELIDSLPSDSCGQRWANALRLLAELGLRPVELLHLEVRLDPISSEPHWWCRYEKRSGGGRTAPRRVHALPLWDLDGRAQQWNLMTRWQAGLIELPPMGGTCPGDSFNTYLNRQPGWKALKAQLIAQGKRLVPYSFRHSYSLRGHRLGIPTGAMADSMGHSIEVHCRSYTWASTTSTTEAFTRAQRLKPWSPFEGRSLQTRTHG
jgi:integrase